MSDAELVQSLNESDRLLISPFEVRGMIHRSLQLFKDRELKKSLKNVVGRVILNFFKNASRQAMDGVYTPVYKKVEKAVKEMLLSGEIDEAIASKVNQFSETQDIMQLLIGQLIADATFTVLINSMIRRQAGEAVASEVKMAKRFCGQSLLCGEDNTPPSPISEKSPEQHKSLIVEQEPGAGDESRKALEGDKNA